MVDVPDGFAQYEQALTSLQEVPDAVNRGNVAAQRNHQVAVEMANTTFGHEATRLAGLRRTIQSRYDGAVGALKAHGVVIPARVRPESPALGDVEALREAVDAHIAVLAAVESQLRRAAEAESRAKHDATHRIRDAQRSSDALRARQERIRVERERAEENARIAAEQAAVRNRRLLFLSIGAGAILLLTVIVIIVTH